MWQEVDKAEDYLNKAEMNKEAVLKALQKAEYEYDKALSEVHRAENNAHVRRVGICLTTFRFPWFTDKEEKPLENTTQSANEENDGRCGFEGQRLSHRVFQPSLVYPSMADIWV